jgi:hypothetical protein
MNCFKNELILNNLINEPSCLFPDDFEFMKIFRDENEKGNDLAESFNEEYFIRRYYINSDSNNNIYKPNLKELTKNDKNTGPDSNQKFISKKKKALKKKENMNNNEEENNIEIQKDINISKFTNKKRGRKKAKDNDGEVAKHNKSSKDNLIRKLKRYILDFILFLLNHSIKFKSGKFRPLNKKMKERLKKDENLDLLNKTIANIFSNTKMNKVSEKKRESNKDLIEKIYKENIETETIKILGMSFQSILNLIKVKYLDPFLAKIKEKEIKIEMKNNKRKDFDIESYMNDAKNLLLNFEEWFRQKKGRDRKKKI